MKTYVLVHGAWHGAWSYQQTKLLLERSGAKVITFDLPGHGNDKTDIPNVTMQAYVQKVEQELQKIDGPVTLVGHSLAGFTVSQVAEEMPEKVEKLVFVSAMIPYDGKTIFEILNDDSGSEILKNLIFAEDKSWATVNEETLKKVLYNGATEQQIMAAAPNLVRQATQPFFAPVSTTDLSFGRVEKAYIVCEKDKIISQAAQKKLIQIVNCSKSVSIPTGHVPHVENPQALADAIAKV